MRNSKKYALAFAVALALPSSAAFAADTTTYALLHASEPALAPGQARFYFYRDTGLLGFALQPTIMIDGQSAGERSKTGDYFYVDRPAGTYKISTETEKEESVTATVVDGQSMYIRFDISMGFFLGHVFPSIIDPQQATKEISDLDYRAPKVAPATTTAPATTATPPASTSAPVASAAPTAIAPAETTPAATTAAAPTAATSANGTPATTVAPANAPTATATSPAATAPTTTGQTTNSPPAPPSSNPTN